MPSDKAKRIDSRTSVQDSIKRLLELAKYTKEAKDNFGNWYPIAEFSEREFKSIAKELFKLRSQVATLEHKLIDSGV